MIATDSHLQRAIAGALRQTIDAHGPITPDRIGSAAKRIAGALSTEQLLAEVRRRAPDPDHGTVEDGFGSEWLRCGPDCDLEVVRPGKVQCNGEDSACPDYDNCENCGCNLLPWGRHVPIRNGECVIASRTEAGE